MPPTVRGVATTPSLWARSISSVIGHQNSNELQQSQIDSCHCYGQLPINKILYSPFCVWQQELEPIFVDWILFRGEREITIELFSLILFNSLISGTGSLPVIYGVRQQWQAVSWHTVSDHSTKHKGHKILLLLVQSWAKDIFHLTTSCALNATGFR